jgi:hypothetical protein
VQKEVLKSWSPGGSWCLSKASGLILALLNEGCPSPMEDDDTVTLILSRTSRSISTKFYNKSSQRRFLVVQYMDMYEGCSEIIKTFSLTSLKHLINL